MQSVESAIVRATADPARPIYHFLPPANWMNDPNGPIFHDGWLHLFYQHNPYGDDWGHMHWGHARSRDLVHWEHLPIALWPSLDQGEEHVFSGCAWHSAQGEPLLLYTSVKSGTGDVRPPNEQWAARPIDGDLLAWEKHPANPILALETHGGPPFERDWRDPFIFSEAGRTFLVLGGEYDDVAGVALYEADDGTLTRWSYRRLLYQEPRKQGRFLECPNFVKLPRASTGVEDQNWQIGDWVLLISPYGPIETIIGSFDVNTLSFTPQQRGVLDAGCSDVPNYYASNIVFDEQGRCLLLAWVRGFAAGYGWNGCLALPRILSIGADGHPRQRPAPELAILRGRHYHDTNLTLSGVGRVLDNVSGDALEIEVLFALESALAVGLRVRRSADGQAAVLIRYDGHTLHVAGTEIALALGEPRQIRLHLFLDKSVLEVYVDDGRAAVTRLIDSAQEDQGVELFAEDGRASVLQIDAWEMQSIEME